MEIFIRSLQQAGGQHNYKFLDRKSQATTVPKADSHQEDALALARVTVGVATPIPAGLSRTTATAGFGRTSATGIVLLHLGGDCFRVPRIPQLSTLRLHPTTPGGLVHGVVMAVLRPLFCTHNQYESIMNHSIASK